MTLSYADTHAPSGDMVWPTSLVVSAHVIAESASAIMAHGKKNNVYKLKNQPFHD
jgi:hypothetical protein